MSNELTISVIEDHDLLRETTVALLQENGFVAAGYACAEAVEVLEVEDASEQAALYIVDLNLPGENGLELSRRVRKAQPGAGIVMVTALSELPDRVAGYHSGADVYLVKPVEPEELLAVVHALRARILPTKVEREWWLEPSSLKVVGSAGAVQLTHPEVRLLHGLIQAENQTLTREDVALHLNLTCEDKDKASLNVRLSQLRRKLRTVDIQDPSIKSVRNRGLLMCFKLTVR